MVSCSSQPFINGNLLLSARKASSSKFDSSAILRWGLRRDQDVRLISAGTKRQISRVLANPNVNPKEQSSKKEVIMVDPLEAKRLAAKQMEQIKAREEFKRRKQIEAINGAWAMIGLTAGLVIEGHTGNSILSQLAGYWNAFIHLFIR